MGVQIRCGPLRELDFLKLLSIDVPLPAHCLQVVPKDTPGAGKMAEDLYLPCEDGWIIAIPHTRQGVCSPNQHFDVVLVGLLHPVVREKQLLCIPVALHLVNIPVTMS